MNQTTTAQAPSPALIQIENREQLLAALGEASEIEHNLMCCYLYAMFSLKSSITEGLGDAELQAVRRWRRVMLGIAMEEMTHLTLVANLTSALGAQPHFMRPNFPVSPGLYPDGVVIELAPFDLDTLDHFVFLERPHDAAIADGDSFVPSSYRRHTAQPRVMPFGGEYATVGDLYAGIRDGIQRLAAREGESRLFCGDPAMQIRPADASLPGLVAILDLGCAMRALDTIVIQGEGSTSDADSHYARFCGIRAEYKALLAARPDFVPAHAVARNPVMRPPVIPTGRLHITAEPAASLVDVANATYAQMLRHLQQVYSVKNRHAPEKRILLKGAFQLMRVMTVLAERLAQLPASDASPGVMAGMSFATIRMLTPLERGTVESELLRARVQQLIERLTMLAAGDPALAQAREQLAALSTQLDGLDSLNAAAEITERAMTANPAPLAQPMPASTPSPASPTTSDIGVEHASGTKIDIDFETRRCIHSRHCVLGLPQVFLANTPGEWIKPDATTPERLVAISENCPSGAIRYKRHDGGPQESAPLVNTLHVRENGPLAIRAPMRLRGQPAGFRATLCRCGRSGNKPFCDGSHNGQFTASGEPVTIETAALSTRDGPLSIEPQRNGPLEVTGNLEICAGTGRTVARVTEVRLCRCGGSGNKPFCDSSHLGNGFEAD